jgi:cytochrome b561
MLRNTEDTYGLVAVLLHWLVAVVVVGLFILGLWMVDLTYYDAWYRTAPSIHKALGVLLFITVVLRLGWRVVGPRPVTLATHSTLEQHLAKLAHGLLYGLLFAAMLSGYLISTADGSPINVFGLFQVPATISGFKNQADIAGDLHLGLAITLISLAALHALAALKHHFVDRDRTLLRMLGRRPQASSRRPDPESNPTR